MAMALDCALCLGTRVFIPKGPDIAGLLTSGIGVVQRLHMSRQAHL